MLAVYASKGRKELPDATFLRDGDPEVLAKDGSFLGLHLLVPREGVAVLINAFNFPVWGMLEKVAPALLAGVPVLVKPATPTAYVAEAAVRLMVDSGALPDGARATGVRQPRRRLRPPDRAGLGVLHRLGGHGHQAALPSGGAGAVGAVHRRGRLAQRLRPGPGRRARHRRVRPLREGGRPGDDDQGGAALHRHPPGAGAGRARRRRRVGPGRPAGQGRRRRPPPGGGPHGTPRRAWSSASRSNGRWRRWPTAPRWPSAGPTGSSSRWAPRPGRGAFLAPTVLVARDAATGAVHDVEPFGPVCTVLPYDGVDEAVDLARLGKGSLVVSVFTPDAAEAGRLALGLGAHHGRVLLVDERCGKTQTGHGSPMPHLVHGGPGRAGGGEELGGIRSVHHHLQRVAVQGSPDTLSALTGTFLPGATRTEGGPHPFTKHFEDLAVGDSLVSREADHHPRRHRPLRRPDRRPLLRPHRRGGGGQEPDLRRAGGPRLLRHRRRRRPVRLARPGAGAGQLRDRPAALHHAGETRRRDPRRVHLQGEGAPEGAGYGEVRWDTQVINQDGAVVAAYDVLTMVATKEGATEPVSEPILLTLLERSGDVAELVLNRPERRNALDGAVPGGAERLPRRVGEGPAPGAAAAGRGEGLLRRAGPERRRAADRGRRGDPVRR